jgi:predicted dehydrogenase
MTQIDRRQFLAAAGVGAGSAALGQTVSTKIRVGILCIQHSHLNEKLQAMYNNPDYDVVSVCEPEEATRRERGNHPLLKRLRWVSIDDMLGDKSVDLVVFEGEVKDAVPFGMRVLDAGKHLHLEKPPTSKMEPFRNLVELARRRDRKLQLGYIWRFHEGADAALEACRKGWLGDIFMIRATINSDRDMKQRAVEARYPGGSMFELGGHVIDRVITLLGRPAQVRQWLRHDTNIQDTVKDNTLAVFEYPSAIAVIVSSNRDAANHRSFEAIGTDGSITIEPMEPVPTLRSRMRESRGPYKKGAQEIKLPPQPRFIKDFEDLARAIKSGTPLRYSYDHELLLHGTLLRASGEII